MSWNSHEVYTIELGTMLGQVAIMPQQTDSVSLAGYGGDEQIISGLRANVQDGVLCIEGESPFKPDQPGGFGGGSVHIGGRSSFSTSGRGGQRVLIVNGREVDLSRSIQLALIVPVGTNVRVGDMIGAVGIGPNLGGALVFSAHFETHVFAHDVTKLTGEVKFGGRVCAKVQLVRESADIYVNGQGDFVLGSVGGNFDAQVCGEGKIRVSGGNSLSMNANISGHGSIDHCGTVLGGARLWLLGKGEINASRVSGDVNANVSEGWGGIVANGRRYTPRW